MSLNGVTILRQVDGCKQAQQQVSYAWRLEVVDCKCTKMQPGLCLTKQNMRTQYSPMEIMVIENIAAANNTHI